LLEDGLGDTIRVSLTEEPEAEVPVAKMLADRYITRKATYAIPDITRNPINPYAYTRRAYARSVEHWRASGTARNCRFLGIKEKITAASLFALGYQYSVPLDKWNITDMACDYIFLGDKTVDFEIPGTLGLIYNHATWLKEKNKAAHLSVHYS
jgi:(E)-4-hydroxy-3-methylbut-2-enyl-diphosphate synthase